MVTKLHMVILMQPDLPAAVAFYKKLGLYQVFYVTSKWAEFQLGETKIGLCPLSAEESAPVATRTGLVFEVPDLASFMDGIKDSCEFLGNPIEKPHGIMASIKDPGGNIIDVYQPTPEKLKEYLANQAKEEAGDGCCGQRSEEVQAKTKAKKAACASKKQDDCCSA
jgi:predicted enzyme related to lactoylglutathione lyase